MVLGSLLNNNDSRLLQQNGFSHVPNIIDPTLCNTLLDQIRSTLRNFMNNHHGTSNEKDYFSAVNRWPLAKLVKKDTLENLLASVSAKLALFFHQPYELYEADVIYKSPIAFISTPCHQDIPYAWQKPYLFSIWIALTNVTKDDSALQFLPGSHRDAFSPAVDFWRPDFIDEMKGSSRWLSEAVTCPVNAGSGLLFFSSIWHASLPQNLSHERFAIVLRWGGQEFKVHQIPAPIEVPFGIWNCGEITYQLLFKGLNQLGFSNISSLQNMIDQWLLLIERKELPFNIQNKKATSALKQLKYLDAAYHAYGGGDGQGVVYPNLWREFLKPLMMFIEKDGGSYV